ncbi:MAG: hypothetical protein HY461_02650 [Parcubacteria group bacterium]|nr:hypothetical protein [Parcubacteria group bacterium]
MIGCNRGGSSSGRPAGQAAQQGGGVGTTGTTTVLGATHASGAAVTTSPINYSMGPLVTGVSRNGQAVSGDLNFVPWQPVDAGRGQVQQGSTVTWQVTGQGTGNPVSLTA